MGKINYKGRSYGGSVGSNPNLLINGDFGKPIKQRGDSIWVTDTTDKYTIDRWKSNGCSVVTTNGAFVTIIDSYKDSKGSAYLTQLFENGLENNNYTVTISISNVSRGYLKIYLKGNEADYFTVDSVGVHSYTFKNNSLATGIVLELVNFYGDLKYIKLEHGSVATPFVPRLYAEELALCEKYYIKYNGVATIYYDYTNNKYGTLIPTEPMRTRPSVLNASAFGLDTNSNGMTSTSYVVSQIQEGKVNITFTFASTKATSCQCFNVNLELDAEIY